MNQGHNSFIRRKLLVFSSSPRGELPMSSAKCLGDNFRAEGQSDFRQVVFYARRHLKMSRCQRSRKAIEDEIPAYLDQRNQHMETTTQNEMPPGAGKSSVNPDAL